MTQHPYTNKAPLVAASLSGCIESEIEYLIMIGAYDKAIEWLSCLIISYKDQCWDLESENWYNGYLMKYDNLTKTIHENTRIKSY